MGEYDSKTERYLESHGGVRAGLSMEVFYASSVEITRVLSGRSKI